MVNKNRWLLNCAGMVESGLLVLCKQSVNKIVFLDLSEQFRAKTKVLDFFVNILSLCQPESFAAVGNSR